MSHCCLHPTCAEHGFEKNFLRSPQVTWTPPITKQWSVISESESLIFWKDSFSTLVITDSEREFVIRCNKREFVLCEFFSMYFYMWLMTTQVHLGNFTFVPILYLFNQAYWRNTRTKIEKCDNLPVLFPNGEHILFYFSTCAQEKYCRNIGLTWIFL